MPTNAFTYSKCSMKASIPCTVLLRVRVVCGAASIPITPPLAAHASSTSSGASRFDSHRARAPMCDSTMGCSLHSMVSSVVWSPQWEQSMSIPSLFMRPTARRPNIVSPPSRGSFSPDPSALASL